MQTSTRVSLECRGRSIRTQGQSQLHSDFEGNAGYMKSCPQKTRRKQSNRPSECIWWKMLPGVAGVEKKNAQSFEQVTY